jgi:hypothetical protein
VDTFKRALDALGPHRAMDHRRPTSYVFLVVSASVISNLQLRKGAHNSHIRVAVKEIYLGFAEILLKGSLGIAIAMSGLRLMRARRSPPSKPIIRMHQRVQSCNGSIEHGNPRRRCRHSLLIGSVVVSQEICR